MRRSLPLLVVVLAFTALPSCRDEPVKPVPPTVTDTRPLGEGLKVIGFALLGASIVLTLGKVLR